MKVDPSDIEFVLPNNGLLEIPLVKHLDGDFGLLYLVHTL